MPEHSESQDSVPLSLLTAITGMLLHKYRDSEPISLKVLLQQACFLLSSSSPTHPHFMSFTNTKNSTEKI